MNFDPSLLFVPAPLPSPYADDAEALRAVADGRKGMFASSFEDLAEDDPEVRGIVPVAVRSGCRSRSCGA